MGLFLVAVQHNCYCSVHAGDSLDGDALWRFPDQVIGAAAFALLVAALLWMQDDDPHFDHMVSTGVGEQKTVTLPDGSTVQLNAETAVSFTETEWPEERNSREPSPKNR